MLEKNKNRRKAFLTGLQRDDFFMRGGLGEGGSHNLVARPPTAFSTFQLKTK